jgi:hypothetical protein
MTLTIRGKFLLRLRNGDNSNRFPVITLGFFFSTIWSPKFIKAERLKKDKIIDLCSS